MGLKVYVPFPLSVILPSPLITWTSVTERESPSTSEALRSSWSVEIRSLLSSSIAPRLTRPETTGASLTGSNEKDWLAFIVPPFESETK